MESVAVTKQHQVSLSESESVLATYKPCASVAGYWLVARFGRLIFSLLVFVAIFALQIPPAQDQISLSKLSPFLADIGGWYGVGLIVLLLFAMGYVFLVNAAKGYQYVVTNERVILTYGFLSINSRSIPMDKLVDVNVRASFFERLFGLASVRLDCLGTVFASNRRRSANNTTAMEGLPMVVCNEAMALITQQMRANKPQT